MTITPTVWWSMNLDAEWSGGGSSGLNPRKTHHETT